MNKTYKQSPGVQLIAVLFILLVTPIFIIFGQAYQAGELDDPALFGLMALFFLPFYVGSWWLLWAFNGRFHLTDDAITLKQVGRETEIPYSDIIRIEERSQPAPHLRVQSRLGDKIIILYQTERFSDLYAGLKRKTAVLQQAEEVVFPLNLRLPANDYKQGILPTILILLFFGALTAGLVNDKPHLTIGHGVGFMAFILLLILLVVLLIDSRSPTAVTFSAMSIKTRSLFGKEKEWMADTITRVERERIERYYRGTTHVYYPLTITFADGEKLRIDEGRIWAFGYAPDRLYAIVARQYQGQQANANTLIAQANKHYEAGDLNTAISLYNQAIALFPAYTSYKIVVADALFKQQRPSEALVAYQELVAFTPEHDQGWVGVGNCQMLLGDLSAAVEAFARVISINPDDALAHYNLAMVQAKQNQRAAASDSLRRALELNPDWRTHVEQNVLLRELL